MAAKIEAAFDGAQVTLIEGGGGDFIVNADGKELWNKKQTHNGQFPDEDQLVATMKG